MRDIRETGYSLEDLLSRRHNAAFKRLMGLEWARAKDYFKRARGLLDPRDRRAMLPAEVMAAVYEDVLDRIRDEEYRVFFQKIRVPGWRKAFLAARAWLYCRFS